MLPRITFNFSVCVWGVGGGRSKRWHLLASDFRQRTKGLLSCFLLLLQPPPPQGIIPIKGVHESINESIYCESLWAPPLWERDWLQIFYITELGQRGWNVFSEPALDSNTAPSGEMIQCSAVKAKSVLLPEILSLQLVPTYSNKGTRWSWLLVKLDFLAVLCLTAALLQIPLGWFSFMSYVLTSESTFGAKRSTRVSIYSLSRAPDSADAASLAAGMRTRQSFAVKPC